MVGFYWVQDVHTVTEDEELKMDEDEDEDGGKRSENWINACTCHFCRFFVVINFCGIFWWKNRFRRSRVDAEKSSKVRNRLTSVNKHRLCLWDVNGRVGDVYRFKSNKRQLTSFIKVKLNIFPREWIKVSDCVGHYSPWGTLPNSSSVKDKQRVTTAALTLTLAQLWRVHTFARQVKFCRAPSFAHRLQTSDHRVNAWRVETRHHMMTSLLSNTQGQSVTRWHSAVVGRRLNQRHWACRWRCSLTDDWCAGLTVTAVWYIHVYTAGRISI